MCTRCKGTHIVHNGHDTNGRERYKCAACGKRPSERTGTLFYRRRFPEWIIRITILMHLKVPASTVQLFLLLFFRCYVSEKTICAWSRKFLDQIPDVQQKGRPATIIIRHTDEKKIKIAGREAWWWNTADPATNVLTSSISWSRSLLDTRKHLKKHRTIEHHIDMHVTDGMQSYIRATHLFGRTTKHVVRGLQEKGCMRKKRFFMLSNLAVERANSRVDAYIKLKVRESFSSFEQAERTRKAFMLTQIIQRHAFRQKGYGTFFTALNEHPSVAKVAVPQAIPC